MSRNKILIVTSRIPWPLDKGDKLRAYHQIKSISEYADVYLFCLDHSSANKSTPAELKSLCKEIHIQTIGKAEAVSNLIKNIFSQLPFQVAYFCNEKIHRAFDHFAESVKPDLIYSQLIRTAPLVKNRKEKKILDYMDVFSKGVERRQKKTSVFLKPIFKTEKRRLEKFENLVFDWFDKKIIISEQDRNCIPHPNNKDVRVVANGVDIHHFAPIDSTKEYEILFNGNMSYPPNIEAAEFLCKKILPIVHKTLPEARVLISGTTPSKKILSLQNERVHVTGFVPDIRLNFAKCKVLSAPMQSSIGLQNKLLEAMAMGIPCVTSTLANNALKAKPDYEILVADSPEVNAEKIIQLLQDKNTYLNIQHNALQLVQQHYSWEKINYELLKILEIT